jgi:hypothetical protein
MRKTKMRPVLRITFLFSVIFVLIFSLGFAWTTPRRVINDYDNHNAMGLAIGDTLHVVNSGVNRLFYLFSPDDGFCWSSPFQPADSFFRGGWMPDITADSSGILHMVWMGWEYPDAVHQQIYHFSSTRIFYSNTYVDYPRIVAEGDSLFVLCRANFYILFIRSLDGGLTWTDSTVLDTINFMGYHPSILYSEGRLHAIYSMNIDGDSVGIEVYYRSSDDFGLSWAPRIPLSTAERLPHIVDSQGPSAYADTEGHVVIAWFDYKYGSYCGVTGDILARVSTDNGTSWFAESRLTYSQSGGASSCLIIKNIINVVWEDGWPDGCSYPKIEYATSSDWGQTWSVAEIITGPDIRAEMAPMLFCNFQGDDTLFHCLFDVNFATYYMRDREFVTNVGPIQEVRRKILKIGAYPNVFNSSATITIESSEGSDVEVEIFNINGQVIWRRTVSGKEGRVIWDATDNWDVRVCSGMYFVRVRTSWSERATRLIFVK